MPLPNPVKKVSEPLKFGYCTKHDTWLTKKQAIEKCLKKYNDKCKSFQRSSYD